MTLPSRGAPSSHAPVTLPATHPPRGERRDALRMAVEQAVGALLHARQQVGVEHAVGDAPLRETGLARISQRSLTSQLEIAAHDLETILILAHHLEPCARQ